LAFKVNYHFHLSAALPYYLNWLGEKLGGTAGATPLKVFAVIVTFLSFVAYVACWVLSARRRELLKAALLLYSADTVMLVIFAFALLNNPFSCLLEILTHLIGIALLYDGYRSAEQLAYLSKKRRREQPAAQGVRYE
jgi:predicted membrane protein